MNVESVLDRIANWILVRGKSATCVKRAVRNGQRGWVYHGHFYPEYLSHGNACSFIAEVALRYCVGRGVDIGADRWPLSGAEPIYNEVSRNAYNLNDYKDESLDYVFSSHCLEHLDRWPRALKLWISKLCRGGILFLYLPHESMELWNPGGPWLGLGHR